MTKLRPIQTSELDRFQSFLDAAQDIFIKSQLDVTLEAALFEILDKGVTDEDVIPAAHAQR